MRRKLRREGGWRELREDVGQKWEQRDIESDSQGHGSEGCCLRLLPNGLSRSFPTLSESGGVYLVQPNHGEVGEVIRIEYQTNVMATEESQPRAI